jgi:DNA-binding beta-propeller fold protein YncE
VRLLGIAVRRLFVGALENDWLEVVDLASGKRVKSLGGLGGPPGVVYLPDNSEVRVAARNTGNVLILDATR